MPKVVARGTSFGGRVRLINQSYFHYWCACLDDSIAFVQLLFWRSVLATRMVRGEETVVLPSEVVGL